MNLWCKVIKKSCLFYVWLKKSRLGDSLCLLLCLDYNYSKRDFQTTFMITMCLRLFQNQ